MRALTAALTWQQGQRAADTAARLRKVGVSAQLAATLAASLEPWIKDHVASTLRVIYPQYAGLSDNLRSASVMLVGSQAYVPVGGARAQTREFIVDVRLQRTATGWRVMQLRVPQLPAPLATLSAQARRVLTNSRLVLPEPARADISAGLIDDRVLRMLDQLSQRWTLRVLVLKSGHPINVFGTNRTSNHTLGKAVDVWAIDDVPVIDQQRAAWAPVMREAARLGANEIGGPVDLDKVAGRRPFFTDNVHQDHLHLGYDKVG